MPAYAIIAKTPENSVPPVGTIVPESMTQPDEVVTISLRESGFDPGEFPELSFFLTRWGYEPGELPPDSGQLRARGVV